MRVVDDFPTPQVSVTRMSVNFIRSKCDPRFLIRCDNGDVFTRADGDNWMYPAYEISRRDLDAEWERPQMRGAYCDDKTYESTKAAA